MAVFTTFTSQQLTDWLRPYAIDNVQKLQGIETGIENSNYILSTQQGCFILTLFEQLSLQEVSTYAKLLATLAAQGIPCPCPVIPKNHPVVSVLAAKPALLVPKISGCSLKAPCAQHCAQIGTALGQIHATQISAADYDHRSYAFDLNHCLALKAKLLPKLCPADTKLLQEELQAQLHFQQSCYLDLPQALIHGDLFRDNALFDEDRLSAILDFYVSGTGMLLFDLAVTVLDWCLKPNSSSYCYDSDKFTALLNAYHAQRALSTSEKQAWQAILRLTALRFWISRLNDALFPRKGTLIQPHDPTVFRDILIKVKQPSELSELPSQT